MAQHKRKEETAENVINVTDKGTVPADGDENEKKSPLVTKARVEADKRTGEAEEEKKPNWIKRFILFLRQVVWELKKTVWPTRKETVEYTGMVLAFVFIMMLILSAYDFGVGKLFLQIFGNQ